MQLSTPPLAGRSGVSGLGDLADRCRTIRLSSAELARQAGVDKFTVYRAFKGSTGTLHASVLAIERALVAEERRVLAALARLHPSEAVRAPEAPPVVSPTSPAGGASYHRGCAA